MGQTTRAEIYDLQLLSRWIDTEDILWLQVAMDNLAFFEEDETLEELSSIRSDFILLEAHELILFQVLKQVSVEQLKDEALMITEA